MDSSPGSTSQPIKFGKPRNLWSVAKLEGCIMLSFISFSSKVLVIVTFVFKADRIIGHYAIRVT